MTTIRAFIYYRYDTPRGPDLTTPLMGDLDEANKMLARAPGQWKAIESLGSGRWVIETDQDELLAEFNEAIAQPGSGGGVLGNAGEGVLLAIDIYEHEGE